MNNIAKEFYKVMQKYYAKATEDLTTAERIFDDFRQAFVVFLNDFLFDEVVREYHEFVEKELKSEY